jgi:2-iminobutanoate/2-iminopropanoate deaminase
MEMMTIIALLSTFGLAGALAFAKATSSKEVVFTEKAPLPIGPYSQAVKYGDMVFVSGQLGMNLETKKLEATVREQTAASLTNIKAILEAAGSGMDCVLKTTIFLADMNDFPAVNEVYGTFFVSDPPARATVQVAKLPLGALVEIEAVAHVR